MSKRKTKAANESDILKYIAWFLALLASGLLVLAAGYYIGFEKAKAELATKEKKKQERRLELLQKIEETNLPTIDDVTQRLKKVLKEDVETAKAVNEKTQKFLEQQQKTALKKEQEKIRITAEEKNLYKISEDLKQEVLEVRELAGAAHEYEHVSTSKPPSRIKRKVRSINLNKPRLAIIIDDVSVRSQVEAIKALNLDLTMSFLPPSAARPNSAKLAAKEDFYMVHLPMEAQSYSAEEPGTLRIKDTQQEISSRVREIKKLFPKVRYVNNHTGSKYTSDEKAMNRLILALNSNDISFVDSRTTSKTQVPKVMKNFALKYVARDVFLDHHMDKAYVKGQIKQAIKIARSEGVAIAIGHPHVNTLAALTESKHLFKDLDLVLINKVY
ncbi:MAG: divergent polysaccharide deacetylase family protein [Helicobacteraceae bacterium]|nr:divergent polysaccharide deacetylase family protein [Candidatus Sulfurimonas ponti]MBL6973450.1 divergent polysaccharide deacetylase family protein [Sulfurimonas sp.]